MLCINTQLQPERLSGRTSLVSKLDAIVRAYGNKNRMRVAEMTTPQMTYIWSNNSGNNARRYSKSYSDSSRTVTTGSRSLYTSAFSSIQQLSTRILYTIRGVYRVSLVNFSSAKSIPTRIVRQFSRTIRGIEVWCSCCKGAILCSTLGLLHSDMQCEFPLIDSDAEMQTRRKAFSHRERLSEETSLVDDATVRSASNLKMQRVAEMTTPQMTYIWSNNKAQSWNICDYVPLIHVKAINFCKLKLSQVATLPFGITEVAYA